MTETTRFDVPTENVGRDVATSAIAQVVARGVHVACAAIVLFAVLRYLGPERYGDYVLIITILGVATILTELDLPNLATREIAHDPHAAERVIGTITVIRIGLALAAAAVMQVVLLAFSVSPASTSARRRRPSRWWVRPSCRSSSPTGCSSSTSTKPWCGSWASSWSWWRSSR